MPPRETQVRRRDDMTRRRVAWRQRFNRALLALVLEGADLFSAFRRRVSKAAFAVLVGGSVLMVGYLPSTISPSPGASPDPSPAAHIPITEESLVSAEAVVAMLGDCASCHEIGGDMMATKPFPPIAHKTEGWEQCSFCHAPARLAPVPHPVLTDEVCAGCHAPADLSAASPRHSDWGEGLCTTCHGADPAGVPTRPHAPGSRAAGAL